MVKLQYISKNGLFIPRNKKRPVDISLPLHDHVKGGYLPVEQQVIDVSENEARDLMRTAKSSFVLLIERVKEKSKESKKKEIDNG